MPTTKNDLNYILSQLVSLKQINCRPMMGEYLLYETGVLFGGVYDNRLLLKKTLANAKFNLPEVKPYPSAKEMYWVENLDDHESLLEMVLVTVESLKK